LFERIPPVWASDSGLRANAIGQRGGFGGGRDAHNLRQHLLATAVYPKGFGRLGVEEMPDHQAPANVFRNPIDFQGAGITKLGEERTTTGVRKWPAYGRFNNRYSGLLWHCSFCANSDGKTASWNFPLSANVF
jgi:hypothetical protein